MAHDYETHDYDVIIIGAGGSGLRAAIEAKERGLRVALVCKSLLGKAHTVMAEGGMAAAMGHVWPEDNWQVHFRDTMRGGKMLNNWRMAQIHAMEAPDRVFELERWGALFDRTKDGRITQRDFGGHRYARLAHVGDRTGLELIRTLQQKVVSMGTDVFMECKILRLLPDAEGRISGAVGYMRPTGEMVALHRQGLRAGHRVDRQVVEVHLQLVGVGRRRPRHGHLGRGRRHRHGVRAVPPDRHGVAAVGARHPRHRGRARRRRRAAQLRGHALHVQLRRRHVPGRDGGDRRGGRRLVRRPHQQPAHARPAAARRGGPGHQLRGEGGPGHARTAASTSTSPRGAPPEYIRRRLPSMYHQFMELAGVDITAGPMEVGPTCHYMMGGVRVDAETQAATVPGLFAIGEVSGGMHGANRLGGNSLSDLIVFGRRAGIGAADFAEGRAGSPSVDAAEVASVIDEAFAPFGREDGDNPYDVQHELQETMQALVGIIRTGPELEEALAKLEDLKQQTAKVQVKGGPGLQPGLEPGHRPAVHDHHVDRRGPGRAQPQGVARRAHPGGLSRARTPRWARSTSCSTRPASSGYLAPIAIAPEPLPEMPAELRELFEEGH